MSRENFPSHMGLKDIGKVPLVSKLVDEPGMKNVISENQRRNLKTLKNNLEAWRKLIHFVKDLNTISAFHQVLRWTKYREMVADNPNRPTTRS